MPTPTCTHRVYSDPDRDRYEHGVSCEQPAVTYSIHPVTQEKLHWCIRHAGEHMDARPIEAEDSYIQIGRLKIPLVLSRHGAHNKDFPHGNGIPSEFTADLPDDLGDTCKHGGLRVSIAPVHQHSCPSWRMGKRRGPCNCGAEERFKRLLEEAGEPWFLPGFETTKKQ